MSHAAGSPEAIVRMLIVIADARGSVRRSRLALVHYVLSRAEPFLSMGPICARACCMSRA